MADKIFTGRVKLKKDTKTKWETQNPVLLNGEIGIATTENGYQVKCGDGSSTWNALVSMFGTAATKDVPTSGNASTAQVVMGNDTRLSDSRPASDVYAWAKASTKPTYSYGEITGTPTVDSALSDSSTNPVQNQAVTNALKLKLSTSAFYSKTFYFPSIAWSSRTEGWRRICMIRPKRYQSSTSDMPHGCNFFISIVGAWANGDPISALYAVSIRHQNTSIKKIAASGGDIVIFDKIRITYTASSISSYQWYLDFHFPSPLSTGDCGIQYITVFGDYYSETSEALSNTALTTSYPTMAECRISVDFPSGDQTDSSLQKYGEGESNIYANTIAGYSGWAVVRTYWENPTGTRILQIVEFETGVKVTRTCIDGTWGEWKDPVGDINSVLEGVL